MSNEITHNFKTGQTLYACRFQPDGDVFLTNGASDEVWGTGGRDADFYDVTMTEENGSGHYKGDFDTSANIIVQDVYPVVVFLQVGVNPADSDPAIAQGEMSWTGVVEIDLPSLKTDLATVTEELRRVKNVYGSDVPTAEGTFPESLIT